MTHKTIEEQVEKKILSNKYWYEIQTVFDAIRCGRPVPIPDLAILAYLANDITQALQERDRIAEERGREMERDKLLSASHVFNGKEHCQKCGIHALELIKGMPCVPQPSDNNK